MLLQQQLDQLNRAVAPPIKEPVEFEIKFPPCEKHVLSNGVEVYMVNMGTEDTLMVNWVFDAGNWYEEQKGVAAATNFLLKNGTTARTAFEINEHFEYYGSYINRNCYHETSEITLHCLNKHIDHLLPAVAELICDSILPEEELRIYVQNARQRLKVNLMKCDFVAGRLIDAALFGDTHPYGRYTEPADLEKLKQEDLRKFYDRYYRNGSLVLFAAGRIPDGFLAQLENHFGKLPLSPHKTNPDFTHDLKLPAPQKSFITNDPNGVQSAIRIARPFPNRHHPDFQKTLVLNTVFGGFFGARLMTNIREDKGYTYGIYSYIMNQVQTSGWAISTEAGRDVTAATIEEIYKEMQNLREELIDEEELQMTRNYMIGSILGDIDGPFQVMARWKNLVLNGLDESYFYNGIRIIKEVSAEELKQLAEKYLQPEAFYELVVV